MRKLKETVADVEWLVSEWDYNTNSALGIFPDKIGSQSNTYAFWKCKFGHKWKARINNRYHGRGCPECRKQLKTSFPEQAVFFYIKKKFPDAINSFRDLFSNGMEIDVYIPSIRTGIEYDGIAWHKDDTLEKEERKYEICKQNGITLIRLKENVEHYRNDLNIADQIILVRRPFVGKQISYAGIYIDKYSNPYGYRLWFEKQMWDLLVERKQQYATANNTVIDRVPNFKIRTPLQQAIQLLKRHRDIVFQNNDDLAPASIIITTLAAKAYGNQIDLYEALSTILADMASYIELRNGVAWIPNPVMTVENFAEKWQAEPEKAKAFYSWLKVAKKQLLDDPISMFGLDAIGKHYIDILGELPVKRALNTLGEETRFARSSGGLFVNGLTGGVTKSFSDSSKKVKEHTFFG